MKKKIFILGIACFFLILIVTSLFGKKGVMDLRRARQNLAALDIRVRTLEAEKTRLEAEIGRLEKDPRAVERPAREKLGLIEPGEKVVVIPAPPVKK
ncbi:MAG: septum formation initiator family protein [Candidatus Aminicenantes bacterium]|nr:septum formation initiator family protein [Candidatus Aminicenantes bacterium]